MKAYYDCLLVGATAFAAGAVSSDTHRELSFLVLESGCTPAREFSAAFYDDGSASGYLPKSPEGDKLRAEFIRRGALTSDGIWLPAAAPMIADRFRGSNADVYFMSVVTDIRTEERGYRVTFSSYGILRTVTVGRIVDTVLENGPGTGWFFGLRALPRTWQFSFYTADADGEPQLRVLPLFADDRGIALEMAQGMADAMEEAILFPSSEITRIPSDRTASVSVTGIVLSPDGYDRIPSAGFGSVLRAFDCGASAAFPAPGSRKKTIAPAPEDLGSYDMIVVGLGTAGAVCAIRAAEGGLRVLGVENLEMFGGSATAGGVLGYYCGMKGGMYTELDRDARALPGYVKTGTVGAHQKDIVLLSRLLKAGVSVQTEAMFTEAVMSDDGGRVTGIRFSKGGKQFRASASCVVDCTADGAVLVSAGAETIGGRPSDGELQPYSSVFFRYRNGVLGYGYVDNGTVDPFDPDDLGGAILKADSCYVHLLPSYADHGYFGIAPLIGLREGRKLAGVETVSFPSLVDGGASKEPLYYGFSNLDNHGTDSVLESRAYQDWITICGLWGWSVSIPVPKGALIPKRVKGLLTAGRNVSVDHDAAMGLRMKDDCQKSGEAAAVLVLCALQNGCAPEDVPYDVLLPYLTATGCIKPSDAMRLERQKLGELHEEPLWCSDESALEAGLSSDAPGYAMWSCRYGDHGALLARLMAGEAKSAAVHAALAYALTDHRSASSDDAAVRILLRDIEEKDGFVPLTGRKYVSPRAVSALSALGRLHAVQAVPLLLSILNDPTFTDSVPMEPGEFITDRDDLRFQFEITAAASLAEIADAQDEPVRDVILAQLHKAVQGKTFRVALKNTVGIKKDVTRSVLHLIHAKE